MGVLRQTTSPENPDPQGTKSEHVDKTLISNIPGNRYFFNIKGLTDADIKYHFRLLTWLSMQDMYCLLNFTMTL